VAAIYHLLSGEINMLQFTRGFLVFLPFLLLSPVISHGCQPNDKYTLNPDESIIEDLKRGKVVMLADFQHHAMLPYKTLLDKIKKWAAASQADDHLTVILEKSEADITAFYKFVEKDSIAEALNSGFEESTIEDLYFFANLKNLLKIYKGRIIVKGFEENFSPEISFTRTTREKDLWFVNKRDADLMKHIRNYKEAHPKEQLLIFYGAAHLNCGYTSKLPATSTLTADESNGDFLAKYLKDVFGKENVITYNQFCLRRDFFDDKDLKNISAETFLMDSNNPSLKELKSDGYDHAIVIYQYWKMPTPIRYIFAKNNLERLYDIWEEYEKYGIIYNRSIDNQLVLDAISLMSGKQFQFIGEFKQWMENNRNFGFERLSDSLFPKELFNRLNDNPKSTNYREALAALGFGPGITSVEFLPSRDQWNNQLWPGVINHIKLFNAVGIMWIGTDKEKQTAKEYLMNLTEQNFNDPSKYLEYWYSKFCSINFE
jgi:hypothetical protein